MRTTPQARRLALILFASGFCSLVYQVAWLRLLRLVFGASTASTAVVLAIFMGGLGLGGLWLGRRVEAVRNPLAFYAALEAGITLSAAVSPFMVDLVRWLYVALGGTGTLGLAGATVLRLLFSALILGVPTTLMGGTLPAVAQALERDSDRGRRLVAAFYGVNTLGAVSGAFLTTFLLLERCGVRLSVWLACGLNLLLAAAVWALSRRAAASGEAAAEGTARPESVPEPGPEPADGTLGGDRGRKHGATGLAPRLVLSVAFVVGFLFFLMEIVWYRMLAPILGGSSYTFGLILTVALLGIGTGGALYALGAESRRPTLSTLGWTCLLEALGLALPLALGDRLALMATVLRPYGVLGFPELVLGWGLVTAAVVLPAALVAGYQFPLLVALLGSGRKRVGSQVGQAYAWNTWGAILGSLAGGFGLLPLLTAPRLWRLSVWLLVLCGLVLAAVEVWRRRTRRRAWMLLPAPLAAAALALALCRAEGPTAFWRHSPIGVGRTAFDFRDANEVRKQLDRTRRSLLREAEGIESSVALLEKNDLSLYINGKSDGAAQGDAATMVMLGLVGAALHPEPRDALIIGLGTGSSAGWAGRVESLRRVEVVELEPAIGRLAEAFYPVNLLQDSPKVHLRYGDGREYVLTSSESWDLILSEPSNPYRAGVGDLFSRDFYDVVRGRLRPGGLFVQWLQGYDIDAEMMRLVYSTLGSVFAYVETWQAHFGDLLLVAGTEPLVHDFDRIREKVAREPFASGLRWLWRVEGIEGLYSGFVAGDEVTRHLARIETRVSSDDHPLIEFGFARIVGRGRPLDLRQLQALARQLGADRPRHTGVPLDWVRVGEVRQSRHVAATMPELPPETMGIGERARRSARLAYRRGQLGQAAAFWASQDQPPLTQLDRFVLAEITADGGDPLGWSRIEALRAEAPTEADFLAARWSLGRRDGDATARYLLAGLERLRDDPWVFLPVVERTFPLIEAVARRAPHYGERLFAALEEPFVVRMFEDLRIQTRLGLARILGFAEHCTGVFEDLEPYPPWEEEWLRRRQECYQENGHPLLARAQEDLRELLGRQPSSELDPSIPGLEPAPPSASGLVTQ